MFELLFNDLGEGLTEGKILSWECKEGDVVNEGDVLVTIETGKLTTQITSPSKGTIFKINKKEGETIILKDSLVTIKND